MQDNNNAEEKVAQPVNIAEEWWDEYKTIFGFDKGTVEMMTVNNFMQFCESHCNHPAPPVSGEQSSDENLARNILNNHLANAGKKDYFSYDFLVPAFIEYGETKTVRGEKDDLNPSEWLDKNDEEEDDGITFDQLKKYMNLYGMYKMIQERNRHKVSGEKVYRWVKASERAPKNKDTYHIKTNLSIDTAYYNSEDKLWMTDHNENYDNDIDEVEWLEEVSLPVKAVNTLAPLLHFSTLDKMPTLNLLDKKGVVDHVVKIAKEYLSATTVSLSVKEDEIENIANIHMAIQKENGSQHPSYSEARAFANEYINNQSN